MAASVSDKGKQPMEDEPFVPPTKTTRKGPQNLTSGSPVDGISPSSAGLPRVNQQQIDRFMKKSKIDAQALLEIQAEVQGNISCLADTSLFATIIGNPIEAKEVRKRIKMDWKFLSAGFQLVPLANHWFELKFDKKEDRDKVWEGRPFHVAGKLMLMRPWMQDFNPCSESVTVMDLWVRIPGMPTKFVSESILKSIIEKNRVGTVSRVAAFNPNGARLRYPRICINADLKKIPGKMVMVPNEKGEIEAFPLWFEDFPEGCGCCGIADNTFELCPKRRVCSIPSEGVLGGSPNGGAEDHGKPGPSKGVGEWTTVSSKKSRPIPPPAFGHSKADLWKCLGMSVDNGSGSSVSEASMQTGEESSTAVHVVVNADIIDEVVNDEEEPTGEPLVGAILPEVEAVGVENDDLDEQNEEAPLGDIPGDVNHDLIEAVFQDPEYDGVDDDELMDMEVSYENMLDFSGFPADFTQADFDKMLQDIPASSEFVLPNLCKSGGVPHGFFDPLVAPSNSPSAALRFEQLGVEGSVKNESGKRKLGVEEGESASSKLMGGTSKRGKNDE